MIKTMYTSNLIHHTTLIKFNINNQIQNRKCTSTKDQQYLYSFININIGQIQRILSFNIQY
jgi:hypothetical protein